MLCGGKIISCELFAPSRPDPKGLWRVQWVLVAVNGPGTISNYMPPVWIEASSYGSDKHRECSQDLENIEDQNSLVTSKRGRAQVPGASNLKATKRPRFSCIDRSLLLNRFPFDYETTARQCTGSTEKIFLLKAISDIVWRVSPAPQRYWQTTGARRHNRWTWVTPPVSVTHLGVCSFCRARLPSSPKADILRQAHNLGDMAQTKKGWERGGHRCGVGWNRRVYIDMYNAKELKAMQQCQRTSTEHPLHLIPLYQGIERVLA